MLARTVCVALLALAALTQYRLWLDDGNVFETLALGAAYEGQLDENALARQRNEREQQRIWLLRQGPGGYESMARYELGLVGSDETFYQFVPE